MRRTHAAARTQRHRNLREHQQEQEEVTSPNIYTVAVAYTRRHGYQYTEGARLHSEDEERNLPLSASILIT